MSYTLATVVISALAGALAMVTMMLRDSRAEVRQLREELRRRDVAEKAARSLERLTTQVGETEIRRKIA